MSTRRVLPGPPGTRFSSIGHVVETGSTNADLLAAAHEGEPEGAVLVTDHQTAGRGRQARTWIDEPGNSMLMSVLLRPPAAVAALVPLISGLAVTDAVAELLGLAAGAPGGSAGGAGGGFGPDDDRPVALKWPNDVICPVLAERKLCGILAEATTTVPGSVPGEAAGAGARLVVVSGMGMNLRWSTPPPPDIAERAATLEELAGRTVDRWDVVRAVLTHLDRWLTRAAADPSDVLDAYRGRCVTLGRRVRMQTATGEVEGMAVAVADSGALVLDTGPELVELTAGDAHHLGPR